MSAWVETSKGKAWKRKYIKEWLLTPSGKKYKVEKARRFYKTRYEVINLLKNKPCTDCGVMYEPCQMDFDHRPGEIKKFNIGREYCRSLTSIREEMEKCDLVCANCHRLRTYNRGKYDSRTDTFGDVNNNVLSASPRTDKARM